MPHEFFALQSASHEMLTTVLVGGWVMALLLFGWIGLVIWRQAARCEKAPQAA